MRLRPAAALLLLLGLAVAACDHVRPSPIGTHCVNYGRNPVPVCTNG